MPGSCPVAQLTSVHCRFSVILSPLSYLFELLGFCLDTHSLVTSGWILSWVQACFRSRYAQISAFLPYCVYASFSKFVLLTSTPCVLQYYIPNTPPVLPPPEITGTNSTRLQFLPPLLVGVIAVLVVVIAVWTVHTIRHRKRMCSQNEKDAVIYDNKLVYKETKRGSGQPDEISLDHPAQWSGSTPAPIRCEIQRAKKGCISWWTTEFLYVS